MAKKKIPTSGVAAPALPMQPPAVVSRRRRALILPRYLEEEAEKAIYRGPAQDRAHKILIKWADLEWQGRLNQKETELDADFLQQVFGDALGYKSATESPEAFQRIKNPTVPGIGTADGALGEFSSAAERPPLAIIELKGAATDIDKHRSQGRTPVQQCWDYLNALPPCLWGVVSNYSMIRLYHREKTPLAYEEFNLQELRNAKRFRQFYCLFERGGLVTGVNGHPPRALQLLKQTEQRQREVGDALYDDYNQNRLRLIEHLQGQHAKSRDTAIHIAQKLVDRILFVAFCEDRRLIPDKSIETTYSSIPPFTKVTNPRWRNFLDMFRVLDQGDHRLRDLKTGFNGGLFHHDPEVDDLQLDDEWTEFFKRIGEYDFRDEVNVDVLGHLFERSVADVERLRFAPIFPESGTSATPPGEHPSMPKSHERKTLGTYYTPPDFTKLLVDHTVTALIDERFAAIGATRDLTPERFQSLEPSAETAAYWRACFDALREIKVCDPACGSGAFLIQAYDTLEARYSEVVDQIVVQEGHKAETLADQIPDTILTDNLFGVDLSEQAVEITQLALWLRTARRGRTLADLSRNIAWGNSLVTDPAVDPRALDWGAAFPTVFGRSENPGFDCVIGNPPWERLKLQEREFFSLAGPSIAVAVSAAERRRMIAALETTNPELFTQYNEARGKADRTLEHVRASGNFPLTGKGDLNTYMLFAELARKIVAPRGRVGLLVPSGIATDATTKEFFGELMESKSLICLYDFENKAPFFPDVHRSFKFCALVFGGAEVKTAEADFAFFAHRVEDLADKKRHIRLSLKDLKLLNPNTKTCPIFRSRQDAELTKAIYKRVPILIDHNRRDGGNAWGIRFVTMFHQTNDAELFHEAKDLKKQGFKLDGNRWKKGKRTFLPLYEAKMVQAYDHRAASVVVDRGNWMRQGQTERTPLVFHQNPEFTAVPRWWVDKVTVEQAMKMESRWGFLGFKDITSPTNERTMIAAAIPWCAATNHFVLILTEVSIRREMCLLANLNSFALDYVARQKIGGVTLNFFIVEQLPVFTPDRYADRCPWNRRQTLEKWISDRVLALTCTADDMRPLAETADFDPPVHKWKTDERAELTAELDAAFFLLYGITRDDVEYILGTFSGADEPDESTPAMFRSDSLILENYDRLAAESASRGRE